MKKNFEKLVFSNSATSVSPPKKKTIVYNFVTRQTTGTCYDIFNCKYMFNIKSSAIPSSSFWWRFGNDPEFAFFERNVLAKKLPRLFWVFSKIFFKEIFMEFWITNSRKLKKETFDRTMVHGLAISTPELKKIL